MADSTDKEIFDNPLEPHEEININDNSNTNPAPVIQASYEESQHSPEEADQRTHRTEEIVDLSTDNAIMVDISDALSERDKVKYTIHTRTRGMRDMKPDVSVVREHEDFVWLYQTLEENANYAGLIIPPIPPRPDFESSREKLQRLGEGESTMTKEDFSRMKLELEQEYLATFKKTVALHEYESDLSVRQRNTKETVTSFFKRFSQSADEVLLSGQKDCDEFYEHMRNYLIEYHTHVKEATAKAERVASLRKKIGSAYGEISEALRALTKSEADVMIRGSLDQASGTFSRLKRFENRSGNDEELKLADTLNYFARDTQAAKNLLYRRMRCLADYEAANKNLDRARGRNRDIPKFEAEQQNACRKFEDMSALAKNELKELQKRRILAFKKNLTDLAELETKHARAQLQLLEDAVKTLSQSPT